MCFGPIPAQLKCRTRVDGGIPLDTILDYMASRSCGICMLMMAVSSYKPENNDVKNMWKKCEKNAEKNRKNAKKCDEHIWKSSWEGGTLISCSSGLIFLGSSFAAVTLLPAQLLQVENRRGAVQIDRKWTVQIADLLNLAIAKQWLPGAKTSNQMKKEKRTKPQNCFKKYICFTFFHIFFTCSKHMFSHFKNIAF